MNITTNNNNGGLITSGTFFSPSQRGHVSNPWKPYNALGKNPAGNAWVEETDNDHAQNVQTLINEWIEGKTSRTSDEIVSFTKKYLTHLKQAEIQGDISKQTRDLVTKILKEEIREYEEQQETQQAISELEEYANDIYLPSLIKKIEFETEGSVSTESFDFTKGIITEALAIAGKQNPIVAIALKNLCDENVSPLYTTISSQLSSTTSFARYNQHTHALVLPALPQTQDPATRQLLLQMMTEIISHELIHAWMAAMNEKLAQSVSWLYSSAAYVWNWALAEFGFSNEYMIQQTLLFSPVNRNVLAEERMTEMKRVEKILQQGEKNLQNDPNILTWVEKSYSPQIIPVWCRSFNLRLASRLGGINQLDLPKSNTTVFVQKTLRSTDNPDLLLCCHLKDPKNANKQEKISAFKNDIKFLKSKVNESVAVKPEWYKEDTDVSKYTEIMENFTYTLTSYPWEIVKTAYSDLLGWLFKKGYFPEEIMENVKTCENSNFVEFRKSLRL